jgi:5-methylcytosine-specific restriction endonuclease McrA
MSRRKIPAALSQKIREQSRFRCGYCLLSESLIGMRLEFEHLIPVASGGETVEANLWLSCRSCNSFKSNQTSATDPESEAIAPIFNPRIQNWIESDKRFYDLYFRLVISLPRPDNPARSASAAR